ncbi:signal transduction histidine kinase [Flavobacterium arsenatis]|uniref:histidine kinase n=1 Tax=Flavobacterium arsenatis TaxID=1484332 RepID=A0ABU1TRK9_9FLAO|nr:ATP-binding protein [Flavobacterium arsenatis]MDR6968512.1 signal transduction histidine kinase [Flavobacterium arsenatis]
MEKWLDPKTVAIWILVVLAVIAILAVSFVKLVRINFKRMVENRLKESRMKLEYQKNLLESGIVVQEQERKRIAADLHDSLIGKLTILRLKNQTEYNREQIDLLLGETIDEARRISHDLSPPMLEFIELNELLEDMITPWKKFLTIHFYTNIDTTATINQNLKIQIARITQELVTNIYKHSGASDVCIQLKTTKTNLALVVRDNGKGFDYEEAKKGIGLQNIELRMVYLRGSHKIKSSSKGSTAIITLNHLQFGNQ